MARSLHGALNGMHIVCMAKTRQPRERSQAWFRHTQKNLKKQEESRWQRTELGPVSSIRVKIKDVTHFWHHATASLLCSQSFEFYQIIRVNIQNCRSVRTTTKITLTLFIYDIIQCPSSPIIRNESTYLCQLGGASFIHILSRSAILHRLADCVVLRSENHDVLNFACSVCPPERDDEHLRWVIFAIIPPSRQGKEAARAPQPPLPRSQLALDDLWQAI